MVDVQWAFISIITASLAHFILRIIFGRELGPEGLGIYTLAFTIYLFGMQFAAFGIGSALTKYVAEFIDNTTTVRNYVSSGLTSSIITGTLMCIILFIFAPFIAISFFKVPELVGLLHLIAISLPFIAIQKAVLGTLNGFRKMHLYAFLNVIQNVTILVTSTILVLFFDRGITGAVIGFVAPTIVIGILSPILIREYLQTSFFWIYSALRDTTFFGFYIVLGDSVSFLNTQMSIILMGYFLSPSDVGIYAVAAILAQILVLIPGAIQTVTNPVIASLYGKGDIEGVRRVFYSTLKKSFLLTAGSAIVIAVFGPYVIILLFGDIFLASYIPLLILLSGYAIGASFAAVGTTLSSIGKVQVSFYVGVVGLVINIIINLLLIPIFGIVGAAMATSATIIIIFLILIRIINKCLHTPLV
ncbi:membrane protein involved in the export of O-antigen and teichoic acid [Methanoregula formicica SMSP]|uniref:Membrane protein involved in the export of O-antigen and teichoic acid n=2 Tax=Methanoregulaceae TaxID=1198451 RepID=L0HH89_METFS|nr:membrane protein involved in the export of O-antigen and teichoic acid [Methanoregula formicica SMSP]